MLEAHIKRKNNRRPEHGDYEIERPKEIRDMVGFDRMVGRDDTDKVDDLDD